MRILESDETKTVTGGSTMSDILERSVYIGASVGMISGSVIGAYQAGYVGSVIGIVYGLFSGSLVGMVFGFPVASFYGADNSPNVAKLAIVIKREEPIQQLPKL